MSDSIPTEILRKKRTRGKQHKLMSNKSKPKLIQKKLKIGKKNKNKNRPYSHYQAKTYQKMYSLSSLPPVSPKSKFYI